MQEAEFEWATNKGDLPVRCLRCRLPTLVQGKERANVGHQAGP